MGKAYSSKVFAADGVNLPPWLLADAYPRKILIYDGTVFHSLKSCFCPVLSIKSAVAESYTGKDREIYGVSYFSFCLCTICSSPLVMLY